MSSGKLPAWWVRLTKVGLSVSAAYSIFNSFLFVTDSENLENDELNTREVREQLKLIEKWRVLGPLGMLHNFIVYLQASP